ncbi:MAG: Fe(2+)-trafficking protein [Chloroflexota bacterium]
MTDLQCRRCDLHREALAAAPMPGVWGERILTETCALCWQEWKDEQTRIINHENLRPFVPADKKLLYRKMHEFLKLSGDPPSRGF